MNVFRTLVGVVIGTLAMATNGTATAAGAAGDHVGTGLLVSSRSGPLATMPVEPGGASMLGSRIALGLSTAAVGTGVLHPAPSPIVSARMLGDYYFTRSAASQGRLSGFRATSGVLFGPRLGAWAGNSSAIGTSSVSIEQRGYGLQPPATNAVGSDADAAAAVPYVGFGYSSAFDKGRWGVSADVGVMALRSNGAGLRFGRGLGAQSADDALRDLRLAPMLQLGVSYSF